MRRAVITELNPLWKLYERNLDGGMLYWRPWKIRKKVPESLYKGPVGEPASEFAYQGL
jgi:hypothetical protein